MNNKNSKRYSKIAKLIGILSGFVLVLGTSYAVFRVTTTGEKENVVSAGKLDVRIENEQNEVHLENTLPQTEESGKQNTPYTFDVVNKGNINAMYDLSLEIKDDSTIGENYIRYYLTKIVNDKEVRVDKKTSHFVTDGLDSTNQNRKLYKVDTNDLLKPGEKVSYKLYLWVDYDTTTEQAANKVFKANVRVDASQVVKRKDSLLRKADVSLGEKGTAYAYVYEDGTMVVKGNGNLATNISDMDIYYMSMEEKVPYYKLVLEGMGYDVTNINTYEDYLRFLEDEKANTSNISSKVTTEVSCYCYREALTQMGYTGVETITNSTTRRRYFKNNGLMTSDNKLTEEGEKVTALYDEIYNNKFSLDVVTINNIKLEGKFTNIPNGLYTGNENITEVTIPSTVTSIDERAFYNCKNLETITIPEKVTTLGSNAFASCLSLKQISVPGGIKEIGTGAFSGCQSLTSVTLSEGLVKIGKYAFNNDPLLETIQFPSTLRDIGQYAFQKDVSITSVVLPEGMETIGDGAFLYCNNIAEVYLPKSLKGSSTISFDSDQKVKVTLDPTASVWANTWFLITGDGSVGELNLVGTGPTVDFRFSNPFSIKEYTKVKIADTITTIGNNMFNGAPITSIELSDNITSIGDGAFQNASNLATIQIPNSVTKIGTRAFNNTVLQTISIGKNLSEIGENVFDETPSLTKITVDNANPNYLSEDGVLYTKDKSKLLCYPSSKEAESYTIPSTVTSIEYGALNNLLKLDTLVATNYSKQIILGANSKIRKLVVDATNSNGGKTFAKNLKEIELVGEGTMALSVSTYWADSLKSIAKITIHEGITSIRNLDGLTALKEISIPSTITRIEEYSFSGDTSLPEITIPNTVTYVGAKAFGGWTESQTINVDNTEEYAKSKFAQYRTGVNFGKPYTYYGWNTDCKAVINYLRT